MTKTLKKFIAVLMVVLMVITITPINTQAASTKKQVKSVTITKPYSKVLVLKKNKTYRIRTKVEVTGKASKKVTYKSSNPSVARVNKYGKITALKKGKTTITVRSRYDKKKKASIRVVVGTPVSSVKLNKKSATGYVGQKLTLKAKIRSSKASYKKVQFESSNTKVARVNSKGVVTLKAPGRAKITVRTKDGSNKKATCTIVVKKKTSNNNTTTKEPATEEPTTEEQGFGKDLSYEGYKLKWVDEFEGTELNRDDWNVETHAPGWVNSELQEYVDSDDNIIVKDGSLVIKPIKTVDAQGNATYTSGRINTQNKHDFTYGLFEVKAKVPEGMGYLPAFWMMPTNENLYGQWPRCGEIDIMEVMGQENNKLHGTIHYGNPHGQKQGTYVLKNGNFTDTYHIFTCEWQPGSIKWYVDGNLYYEANDWYSKTEGKGTISYPAPFDQPFYMILNLAVGGSWVGYPDETTSFDDAKFEIDYVKAYQKDSYNENVTKPEKEVILRDPDANGNYTNNGDFSVAEDLTDDDNWKFMTANGGVATAEIENNGIVIKTTNEGTVDYSVQLVQAGIPFEKGATYSVSFDAKASEERTIKTAVKAPDLNYAEYMPSKTVALTTEYNTYTYEFKMTGDSDANGRLEFNMGAAGSTADVVITNVVIKKTKEADPNEKDEKVILADGNHVYNGSFDEGDKRLGFWDIVNDANAQISVTGLSDGRRLHVTVADETSTPDKVTIGQKELALLPDKDYELSFDAQADDAKELKIEVAGQVFTANLSADKETFKFKFTTASELLNKDINIALGMPGEIYIDNVRIVEDALIKNGSFNAGTSGFEVYVHDAASASYVVDSLNEDNAMDFTIDKSGDAEWYIQLKQNDVTLEKNQWYTLSFDIKSDIDRSIQYAIQRDGSRHKDANGGEDWTPYVQNTEILKAYGENGEYTNISRTFMMKEDTDNGSIFNIALGGGNISTKHRVCIDNISLVKTEAPVVDKVPVGTELIKNRNFADGMNGWSETIANWGGEFVADAERSIADGIITYDIKNPGTEDWHVQLKQNGIVLDEGDAYRLTVEMESSDARTIITGVMHGTNYSQYGQITDVFEAGNKKQVVIDFIAPESNDDAVFYISLGKTAGENTPGSVVKVSNISLVKIDPQEANTK